MIRKKWTKEEKEYLIQNYPCVVRNRTKISSQLMARRLGITKTYDCNKDRTETKLCKCGCGETILRWDASRMERFYVFGHRARGKKSKSFIKYRRKAWTGKNNPIKKALKKTKGKRVYPRQYEKIRKEILSKTNKCSICDRIKPLQIHHIDGDPYNNKTDNLKVVCRSCHNKQHMI